jgi:hypothetical protein
MRCVFINNNTTSIPLGVTPRGRGVFTVNDCFVYLLPWMEDSSLFLFALSQLNARKCYFNNSYRIFLDDDDDGCCGDEVIS